MPEAFVTLATNDRYALGALVLANSLRAVKTTRDLCILISPNVSEPIRSQLTSVYNNVVVVDVLDSNDSAHLGLLKRPELGVTYTKLHCWTLTQYSKAVFLDADMMAVQNADELFDQPELSASCDVGWPDCFNSGMFVFSPSQDTYNRLLQHAESVGSFDGGDQGLLNTFFTNWNRLSFVYNMVASVTYTYLPAYKQYGKDVKFVHFLGSSKPWHMTYDVKTGGVSSTSGTQEHLTSFLDLWWQLYISNVRPSLPQEVTSNVLGELSNVGDLQHSMDSDIDTHHDHSHLPSYNPSNVSPTHSDNQLAERLTGLTLSGQDLEESRKRWETGRPDYMGSDSFDNIKAFMDSKIQK